jgi:hypothetical protein
MKTKAWRKLVAFGLIGAGFASGCVISSGDDDDRATGGTGGSSGSSGSGGTSGSSGSSGSGGVTYSCSDRPVDATDDCQPCIQRECCSEFLACANGDRTTPCWGNSGEFFCIQGCITDYAKAHSNDVVPPNEKENCINSCAKSSTIGNATNVLYACVNDGQHLDSPDAGETNGCAVECFGG